MNKLTIGTLLFLTVLQLKAAIPNADKLDFGSQITIAHDVKLPMSARWQALVHAAEVARYDQIEQIKDFAKSKEWYMRNATLVALEKINVDHAMDQAKFLLKDKALVVRSAAVDVIASKYNRQNRDLLVEELTQAYNFKKKQSLWIRSKIFNIIAARAQTDDRNFFTKYLFDTDPKIVQSSIATLEKITNMKFESKDQAKEWRDFVKKSGWL